VEAALRTGAGAVVSTYNEPLITAEWAVAVFREARAAGMLTGLVSNGNATPEALEYLRPWTDLYKVDLKSFSDRQYRTLGGRLEPILETIRSVYDMGYWLEIVTLIVPDFNDSDAELHAIAEFLAGVSADIPWHVTAFHEDYKMTDRGATPAATLKRAAAIGRSAGLRFVYAGNVPGIGDLEDTRCPGCERPLVRRRGFRVLACDVSPLGTCPDCGAKVPGHWPSPSPDRATGLPVLPVWD
jgi:pyruvate formate lyase activating enzyme